MDERVELLDRMIQTRHLLKHPFYRAWSEGGLTLDTLREYAGQYYRFESRFPQYVAGTYAHLETPSDRRMLLENLVDEEGRDPTHPELWLDFAESLGLPRSSAAHAPARPATSDLCGTYRRLTQASAESGLGALYAYESIFPEVAREKSRGLREFYGIEDPRAHEFFRVHGFADVAHSQAEANVLARGFDRSPTSAGAAERGVHEALEAWWRFLDQFDASSVRE